MSISVVDYGAGNVAAVIRMVERAGGVAHKIGTAAEVLSAGKLILPGVGAFDHGMSQLAERELVPALHEAVLVRHVPVLGICLGMQMMCRSSEEGSRSGLGWVDADVVRFPPAEQTGLRVPHMGWNTLNVVRDNALLPPDAAEQRFYFVHSYRVRCNDASIPVAIARYGVELVAAFQQRNIYGVQFHPEKSHRFGLELMRHFVALQHA